MTLCPPLPFIYIYILCKSNYWNCIRFPAQIINEQTELARAAQPTVYTIYTHVLSPSLETEGQCRAGKNGREGGGLYPGQGSYTRARGPILGPGDLYPGQGPIYGILQGDLYTPPSLQTPYKRYLSHQVWEMPVLKKVIQYYI